ncbi:hypothetical protein ACIRCZ_19555 [Leifsonia sp. NPDC102414]|uniref:hypothetical protein n=1 Tax=Leifsonia sp. NPDC102414 TaxID=3364124 RepID=UPI0037FE9CE4
MRAYTCAAGDGDVKLSTGKDAVSIAEPVHAGATGAEGGPGAWPVPVDEEHRVVLAHLPGQPGEILAWASLAVHIRFTLRNGQEYEDWVWKGAVTARDRRVIPPRR